MYHESCECGACRAEREYRQAHPEAVPPGGDVGAWYAPWAAKQLEGEALIDAVKKIVDDELDLPF